MELERFAAYVLSEGRGEAPSPEGIAEVAARWPWFTAARIVRSAIGGGADAAAAVTEPFRAPSSLLCHAVDAAALVPPPADDPIERFLRERPEELRIVAEEGEAEEIRTEAELDEEDELVTEDLAEIYLAQGLREEACSIYRKLSLRNPEKSVYFAKLIERTKNNN